MKVLCPNHKDTNPSMHVYADKSWCFVCNYMCDSEKVVNGAVLSKIKKDPENLEESLLYINSLPQKSIRGLNLKYDKTGYYVIYPGKSYYFKRTFSGEPRYIYPRGHKSSLFIVSKSSNRRTLIVVEGVLNALSLDLALDGSCYGVDIVSPGSANSIEDFIDTYMQYEQIILVVDKDPAGIACGEPVRKYLISKEKKCKLIAVSPDFNQTLQTGGKDAVLKQFKQELGL